MRIPAFKLVLTVGFCLTGSLAVANEPTSFTIRPLPPGPGTIYSIFGSTITPQKAVVIDAVVLARNDQPGQWERDVTRTDLLLVWGPAAEPSVLRGVKNITYTGREAEIHYVGTRDQVRELNSGWSNCHMVVPTELQSTLDKIRPGNRVQIKGYLVNTRLKNSAGSGFFDWHSNTDPLRKGNNGCMAIYAQELTITQSPQ